MFAFFRTKLSVSVRLSVTNVTCENRAIATSVINALFESLFHLVLGKVSLVSMGPHQNSPKSWAENVLASSPIVGGAGILSGYI